MSNKMKCPEEYSKTIVIPLENASYTVKKILKGYSFEGLY